MKIAPIIPYYTNFNLNNKVKNSNPNRNNRQYSTNNFVYPPVYFRGMNLSKAQAYLDSIRPKNGFDRRHQEIYALDLNKLDGIQEGIEVFKGLNIKEIAFIARTMLEVATNRGCYNMCSHCYANAMPPVKESSNLINKMSWEDFEALTTGFRELNNRLGFYISAPGEPRPGGHRYLTAFHDADCMTLNLTDTNGNQHDFIDIANALFESTGIKGIFDTSGWTPTDKRMQERAEKFADYYSMKSNRYKLDQFNISLNPFHSLYTKSVAEKRAGNLEKAEKFRNLYTDRMANTIFTFTPLVKIGKVGFLLRAFDAEKIGKSGEGFTIQDLYKLSEEILTKLLDKYTADLQGERKYIKTEKNLKICMKRILAEMDIFTDVGLLNESRLIKYVGTENKYYSESIFSKREDAKKVKQFYSPIQYINNLTAGIIDANGDFYITTFRSTFPTPLKLNFKNGNKQTPPIYPSLQPDNIIKRCVINNV